MANSELDPVVAQLRRRQALKREMLRQAVEEGSLNSSAGALEMATVVQEYDGLLLEVALGVGLDIPPKPPSGDHQFFSSGERWGIEVRLAAAGFDVGHLL